MGTVFRLPKYLLLLFLMALPGCSKRQRNVSETDDWGSAIDGFFSPPADSAVLRFDTWVTPNTDGGTADLATPIADSQGGPLPDLTVSALGAKATGSVVVYTVKVCNTGAAAAGAFYVDVYYHRVTAPPLKAYGQTFAQKPGLAKGACATVTLTRTNAPPGTFKSWAQVDADAAVSESNEGNNVAGPVSVKVEAKQPDLVVQKLKAESKGSTKITVRYRLTICNKGTGGAAATDANVYYNLLSAPKPATTGDGSTTVPALQPGLCVTRDIMRSDPPNGLYTSWARVDVKAAVAESDETNNVAGPEIFPIWHKVPAKTCDDVCAFAISCKVFPAASAAQCKTWCKGQTIPRRGCLLKAASQADCPALQKCNAPPPPPPPPPPAVCSDLCTYISSKCKTSSFYWTCYYACQALTSTTLKCAQEAKLKGQCTKALSCMSL